MAWGVKVGEPVQWAHAANAQSARMEIFGHGPMRRGPNGSVVGALWLADATCTGPGWELCERWLARQGAIHRLQRLWFFFDQNYDDEQHNITTLCI